MIVAPSSSGTPDGSRRAGPVFVDQAPEDLAPLHRLDPRGPGNWVPARDRVGTAEAEPTMGSMRVVMLGVFMQNPRQLSSPEDEHVIQHLPAHPTDQPLDVSVLRRGYRRPIPD